MSALQNEHSPCEFSTDRSQNDNGTWKTHVRSKRSHHKRVKSIIANEAQPLCIGGDTSGVTWPAMENIATKSKTHLSLASSTHVAGLEYKCPVSSDDSSWPNIAEGHKRRVLRNSTSNETFAQKLQVGVSWKSMSCPSTKAPSLQNETSTEPQSISPYSKNDCRNGRDSTMLKQGRKVKEKNASASNLPPQESGVHLINSSLKDKLAQSDAVQNSQLKPKALPQLDKDFPDLCAALKMLPKCSVKNEGFESTAESEEKLDKKEKSKRKSKSNQPCRKDPISINIADFLKETCETSKRPLLFDRRLHLRDIDKRKICGNILDSSNPIRKRGKHREKAPKKRLSKLKQVIVNERNKKREQKELNMNTIPNKNLLSENECVESLVGSLCNQFNSLQIIKGNNDHEYDCSVSKTLELKLDGDKVIEGETHALHENHEETSPSAFRHSRKFRNYCNNIRCHELDEATSELLKEIYRFQDRHYKKDPIKAHARRRFVLGIREVKKYLLLQKLKAIVVAPDLEPVEGPGGLDETIIYIREEGRAQQVPVIFAVGRRQLGFTLKKKVAISIIGIINAEGAEELYERMLKEWHDAVQKYHDNFL
ncbi:Selenocysteine insertion sequence-binding protein 2-like [Frankliniella fusca]|uniref:Selenocysteine insertion sequence-binding protein 2-like n=1 Tax=Frankliniella fusca TaxID=407009 RepID=A0AAE1LSN3_9NEOP|nr:Selenocysteine insertion sequence-binding protein 2-like [Frankliniella fusca]